MQPGLYLLAGFNGWMDALRHWSGKDRDYYNDEADEHGYISGLRYSGTSTASLNGPAQISPILSSFSKQRCVSVVYATGFAVRVASAIVSFPIQFQNGCFLVTLTEQITPSGSAPYTGVNCYGVGSLNRSGLLTGCASHLNNAIAIAEAIRYLAIGF